MTEHSVVFPRKLAKSFILLYRQLPCLWDRKCVNYKHRHKRHEAISKLTQLVQEYDPSATRVHVMRKIESLRACARREHKRVCNSRVARGEVYVPQLWYYDLISFVFGEEEKDKATPELIEKMPRKKQSEENREEQKRVTGRARMAKEKKQSEEERKEQKRVAERARMAKIKNNPELYALWKEKQKESYIKKKRQGTIVPIREMTSKKQKLARTKSRENSLRWYYKNKLKRNHVTPTCQSKVEDIEDDDNTEPAEDDVQKFEPEESYQEMNVPTSMIEITNNIPRQYSFDDHSKRQSGIQDEYDAIGINVAAKLRSLPQSTRILAEKLINDVLFQAQVNGLNPSTFISTPDPFKQDLM